MPSKRKEYRYAKQVAKKQIGESRGGLLKIERKPRKQRRAAVKEVKKQYSL